MQNTIVESSIVSIGGDGVGSDLDFSNDGAMLSVALKSLTEGDSVVVFDTSSGERVASLFSTGEQFGYGVAFVCQGSVLAAVVREPTSSHSVLFIVDTKTWQCRELFDYGHGNIVQLVRDKEGLYLAVVMSNRVDLWRCSDWENLGTFRSCEGHGAVGAAFSSHSDLHMTGIEPDVVVTCELPETVVSRRLPCSVQGGRVIASPCSRFLLVHTDTWSAFQMLEAETGDEIALGVALYSAVSGAASAFSMDGSLLFLGYGTASAFSLPEFEKVVRISQGPQLHPRPSTALWSASAYEAPYIAFSFLRNGPRVAWFKYNSDSSTTES